MPRRLPIGLALFVLLGFLITPAQGESFRFPEKKHGKGELKYRDGIPVLVLDGTPEEIGEQAAVLGVKPASRLLKYPGDVLQAILKRRVPEGFYKTAYAAAWSLFTRTADNLLRSFPPDHKKELEALIKAGKFERALVLLGNTMFDAKGLLASLHRQFGCSVLMVEPTRSETGGMLFGRNLDFPTAGYLNDYSLVTVYRPKGKHAFASVGFPGLIGCLSGMNDAGLTVAVLEVYSSKDKAPAFDPKGTPYALCFRRLLEECKTVDEAEKALRKMKRTTYINLAICDRKHSAVFEITPKSVVVRKSEHNICPCTNHFRTLELCTSKECKRYDILSQCPSEGKVTVKEVAAKLDAVNQGGATLQTMIFEPATLKLHLAIGKCPTSSLPMKTVDLKPLLKADRK
jgi:hypothetical protein